MKRRILNILKALGPCILLAVSCVSAQSANTLIAKVPFDFVVCNSRLAAGEYTVTIDNLRTMVLVRGEDGDSAVMALSMAAHAGKISEQAKLVFKHYGDRYVLSQVWPAATSDGREFPMSKLEKELARSIGKPEIVSLLIAGPGFRKPAR